MSTQTLLEIRDVNKRFGGLQALSGVGLRIERGQIYGLIGPNGAGKTTFFNVITGLYQPDSGSFVLDGRSYSPKAPDQVAKAGLGISTAVGIGGDPIIGTTTKEAIELFMNDADTDAIVMIGEIGGGMEAEAARWIRDNGNKKPVVGFIAGQTAPPGRRMGHAGAIVGGAEDTAAAKMKIMEECGIHVVQSPADIGKTMASVIGK